MHFLGNYTLFPTNSRDSDKQYAKKIAENALGLLRAVLQSHKKLLLSKSFNIKATILQKNHLNFKRKSGTLRAPQYIY